MERTKVNEAQIFPKILFRGLGSTLNESKMAGGKKKLKTNDQLKISPSTALLKPVKGFRINVLVVTDWL